jgi:uncharacterized protein YndB with AHSA1/START domain
VPEYAFLTTWCLEAEREPVWEAIWDSDNWPQWWRGVVAARTRAPGDEAGIGRVGSYTWRSRLPYEIEFDVTTTKVARPHLIEGRSEGELEGIGRWRLFEQDGDRPVTAVVYEWTVSTTKPWMNLLAPIARPVFEWNHDWVMRNGGVGLSRLLGCRLLASD